MVVPLPPKIFKILASAIKGNTGMAREIKIEPFLNVFNSYFGCSVEKRKGNVVKVSPPPVGHGIWYWARVPFLVHKPANGTLGREAVYELQRNFKTRYGWDHKTIVRGPGRE